MDSSPNHLNGSAPSACHNYIKAHGILGFGWMGGVLLFAALTGLGIWLLPFSVGAQMAVLMHTALGLAIVVPFTLWQLEHWLATRNAPWRFRKFCAYAGFWTLAVTTISGIVLTWEAMFSLLSSHFWDRVHLWSGLLSLPFIAYHVWPHKGKQAVNGPATALPIGKPDYSAARRRMWAVSGGTVAALLLVLGVGTIAYRSPGYRHYKLASNYNWTYGKNPFAPSLATTEDGLPVAPQIMAGSKSCGASGCHTEIYQEWQASAHHWAAQDTFFQAVQSAMIKEAGAPATRYCGGCHDPVSLLSGYKDASTGISAPGFKQGDSCVICHSMRRVDVQGNGNYVFGAPKPYLFEYSEGRYTTAVAHFLIRAYPRQHDRDYDITLSQKPESCASCHKQFIDKEINHVGWVQLQNQYDDWKHGKWNADPDPAYRLRCQQCHMYYRAAPSLATADPYDLKIGLGLKHRSHWFAGGNQTMPEMISSPDAAGQTRRVEEWLHGQRVIPEIASIWPAGPVLPIKIVAPSSARPGERIEFRAVISNNKAGHSFPTGPLDLIRAWVEVVVKDGTGREIYHSGKLTEQNHVEPGSFVLKAVGVNPEGQEIIRHDLWHYVGAKYKRAVFPGYSDMYEYDLKVPQDAHGPLQVTARLRYRKANQYFMDFSFPGQHLAAPITDISSDRVEIPLVAGNTSRAASHLAPAREGATRPPQAPGGR
ncbi:MAG TPA: multiheme c-type cytochrome [Terriglobia bacterium]|nr:multiheme c-type cytochrome [Terriglobia bacterium]